MTSKDMAFLIIVGVPLGLSALSLAILLISLLFEKILDIKIKSLFRK